MTSVSVATSPCIPKRSWQTRVGLIPKETVGHHAELDGWRGLAILLVLFSHFFHTNVLFDMEMGRLGVNIFFVLSGVLMGNILFVKRTDLKTFYQRRFSRVFPLFWLYVFSVYGIGSLMGSPETGNILHTLSFTRTYAADALWGVELPIGHLWSLSAEEHAYLLMSVLTFLFFRPTSAAIGLLILGTLSIASHYLMVVHAPEINQARLHTENNLAWIFLPASYAMLKHHVARFVKPLMVWLAFAVGVACYSNAAPWYASFLLAPWCLAFVVNHLEDAGQWALTLLSMPLLRVVGLWSFSIYIWQQPFYSLWIAPQNYPFIESVIAFFLSIAAGALSFYCFENPIRRKINKHWTGEK